MAIIEKNTTKKMTITANNKSLKMNRYTKLLSVMGILAIAMLGMVILDDSEQSDATTDTSYSWTVGTSIGNVQLIPGSTYSGSVPGITLKSVFMAGVPFIVASGTPTTAGTYYVTSNMDNRAVITVSSSTTTYNIGVGVYQSTGGSASVSGGGESTSSSGSISYVTVADSTLMTFTATPSSGYHFVKWIAGSDEAFPTDNPIGFIVMGKDMTFRAVFEADPSPQSYTCHLYYDANGGSGAPSTQSYTGTSTSDHTFTVASGTPTRSGYTFKGWAASSTSTIAWYEAGDSVSVGYNSSKTLYAVWEEASYTHTLYYNANGGSGAPSTQSQTTTTNSSYTFTISSTTPSRSGYTFLGWATSSSASSASYSPGGSISVDANSAKTLFAVWYETTYSVTVYPGGYSYFYWYGSNAGDSTHYTSAHTYTVTAGTTLDIDWKGNPSSTSGTNPVITTSYTDCNYMVTSSGYPGGGSDSVTISSSNHGPFYPANQMTSNTSNTYSFTLSYNANGGSGAPSDTNGGTSSSSTKSITVSSTKPTRTDYAFLGWSTSSTATSATYLPNASYSFNYGTTTLYAVWKAYIDTSKTWYAGEIVSGTDRQVAPGSSWTGSVPGITFQSTAVSGTPVVLASGRPTTAGTYTIITDSYYRVTITVSTSHTYTISADSENTSYGTVTGSGTDEPGTQVSISATPKPSYLFSHWTITGGGTIADSSSASTTVTIGSSNGTVTAHFTTLEISPVETQIGIVGHSISFNASCSPSNASPITYTYTNATSGLTISISGSTITLSASHFGTFTFKLVASGPNSTTSNTTVTAKFVSELVFTNEPSAGSITSW